MTRTSLIRLVDRIVDTICDDNGLDRKVQAKSGQREVANAKLYEWFKNGNAKRMAMATNPPEWLPATDERQSGPVTTEELMGLLASLETPTDTVKTTPVKKDEIAAMFS